MRGYFPHQTGTWKLEEPPAFRRLSMSIFEMAVVTGIALRLYRALALTYSSGNNLIYAAATIAFGVCFLFGMTTLHLGNYTLRQWIWRAPVFSAIEAAAESITALGLIFLGREPFGSGRRTLAEWPELTLGIFFWRFVGIVLFALLLSGVVQFVRYLLLRKEHRLHTAEAVAQVQKGDGRGEKGEVSS
jgi:hypothetical protein